jgi:hypothetical protein
MSEIASSEGTHRAAFQIGAASIDNRGPQYRGS